jgi:hypothetical protein
MLPYYFSMLFQSAVKHFFLEVWENSTNSNVNLGIKQLDRYDIGDGRILFKNIRELYDKYPMMFYPVFRLQNEVMETSLGVDWWELKKREVREEMEYQLRVQEQRERARAAQAKKEEERFNEEVVIKRMGVMKYYCCPWQRKRERARVAKIAATAGMDGTTGEADIFEEES